MKKFLKILGFIIATFFNPLFPLEYYIYIRIFHPERIGEWCSKHARLLSILERVGGSSGYCSDSSSSSNFSHYGIDSTGQIYDYCNNNYVGNVKGNSIFNNNGHEVVKFEDDGRGYNYSEGRYTLKRENDGNVRDYATGKTVGKMEGNEFRSYNRF